MPPLKRLASAANAATSIILSTYDDYIAKRDSTQAVETTDTHTLAVMCVSLSFAIVSVLSAQFAFYWFVRMRRGFRQDMIMLLIQSDMAKALWLIISPLFYFITNQPLSSHWAFCQVSGFFLSVSIEASDIAVLLIAIHTTLFIIQGQHTGANFGLQPYRRVAYTLWATVPIILAAIVPITGASFVDNGPYCYLPVEPSWYSDTLAWGPRYFIFGFIIFTYTGLYLYVYISFRRFGKDQRSASTMSSVSTGSPNHRHSKHRWRSRSVPATPPLTTHGLIDSAHNSMSRHSPPRFRQYSDASTVSTLKIGEGNYLLNVPKKVERRNSITWNLVDFGRDKPITTTSISPPVDITPHSPTIELFRSSSDEITDDSNAVIDTPIAPIPTPEPAHITGDNDVESLSHIQPSIQRNRWQQRIHARHSDIGPRNSLANIITALRQGPHWPTTTSSAHLDDAEAGVAYKEEEAEEPTTTGSSSVHLPTEESEEAMRRSRGRMQRQLRLLFVYPAIYLLTWIAPFVAHAYQYDDRYSKAAYFATAALNNDPLATATATATSPSITVLAAHRILTTAATPSPSLLPYEPLALRIVSMATLCIGAAVDCAFFSAWERPWKHLRGGFWENLAKRLRIQRLCGGRNAGGGFAGRNRDERVVDERVARTRRDREMGLELRSNIASAAGGRISSSTAGERSEGGVVGDVARGEGSAGRRREWWDVLDEAAS
ncbi:G protein-coupled glucose receptor regulating Gpa2-domain-containing protein [Xylaria bambusicola]|uniref:G protein-coupled glucose receptor regulating Gpa2-domain-containing protein n=1 Tax=Xylaria bambusicola TaxID=326684 RepID=UPI0020077FCF|nr:G protein-coupled glucose receptor regulating Gpa2-domain-containing protein [Xylaria bambusicola]KAI0508780.1 G protein-coupled glucose receptor regulating Gpa2-domain-containing protein [Xylaria bambusicola]